MRTFWLALAVAGGLGCGETARRAHGAPVAVNGGEATSSDAGAGASEGGAQATGGAASTGGVPDAVTGGSGGEGGEPETTPRFRVLPALERPEEVPEPTLLDDEVTYATTIQAVSADGGVILGISYTIFSRPAQPFLAVHAEETLWLDSDLEHPQSLGTELVADEVCLAEDGSSALLLAHDPAQAVHFSRTHGLTLLELPSGVPVTSAVALSCSANAERASITIDRDNHNRALYWELGQGDAVEELALPAWATDSVLRLPKDDGPGVLSIAKRVDQPPTFEAQVFSWTPESGSEPLGTPSDQACFSQHMSGDGSVVSGVCRKNVAEGYVERAFRWASGEVTLLEPNTNVAAVSRNGDTLLGIASYAANPSRIVWWNRAGALHETEATGSAWDISGLSPDGKSAYLTGSDAPDDVSRTFRWGGDETVSVLPLLPGFDSGHASLITDDGALAIGSVTHSDQYLDPGRAVIWDATSIRDIEDELDAAQATITGTREQYFEHVWTTASSVHIQGSCIIEGVKQRTAFIIDLPRNP